MHQETSRTSRTSSTPGGVEIDLRARAQTTMIYTALIMMQLVAASAFVLPTTQPLQRVTLSAPMLVMGGKGFGGGEATRDPTPTVIDPNDPKGKQQAIHKAESFAEYLAKRGAG